LIASAIDRAGVTIDAADHKPICCLVD